MNSNSNFQAFVLDLILLAHLALNLFDNLQHLKTSLHDPTALINLYCECSLSFLNPCRVAHNNVSVSNGLNFVNFVFNGELIKPSKELLEELDDLFLVMGKPWHIYEEHRHVFKFVHHPLLAY